MHDISSIFNKNEFHNYLLKQGTPLILSQYCILNVKDILKFPQRKVGFIPKLHLKNTHMHIS